MDTYFSEHLKDLSYRAEKQNIYTFTDFLNLEEQDVLHSSERELCPFTVFGGADGCERVMTRFGSVNDMGYEEDFPIVCIKAEPPQQKFADQLTHRDVLGALMNLGIERTMLGDIFLNDNRAYIFAVSKLGEYITENLTKIRHTTVKCALTEEVPEAQVSAEVKRYTVSSERIDCIISAACSLSRSKVSSLIEGQKVFINGRMIENNSHITVPGDIISVQGFGRLLYKENTGTTKKGKTAVLIETYR